MYVMKHVSSVLRIRCLCIYIRSKLEVYAYHSLHWKRWLLYNQIWLWTTLLFDRFHYYPSTHRLIHSPLKHFDVFLVCPLAPRLYSIDIAHPNLYHVCVLCIRCVDTVVFRGAHVQCITSGIRWRHVYKVPTPCCKAGHNNHKTSGVRTNQCCSHILD